LANEITKYLKSNLPKEQLKKLSFLKKKIIRCKLRALPNEIQGGIAYVNQTLKRIFFLQWNIYLYRIKFAFKFF
jgi:hypothetical protein